MYFMRTRAVVVKNKVKSCRFNFGPQHPANSGVFRFNSNTPGEHIKKSRSHEGLLYRGTKLFSSFIEELFMLAVFCVYLLCRKLYFFNKNVWTSGAFWVVGGSLILGVVTLLVAFGPTPPGGGDPFVPFFVEPSDEKPHKIFELPLEHYHDTPNLGEYQVCRRLETSMGCGGRETYYNINLQQLVHLHINYSYTGSSEVLGFDKEVFDRYFPEYLYDDYPNHWLAVRELKIFVNTRDLLCIDVSYNDQKEVGDILTFHRQMPMGLQRGFYLSQHLIKSEKALYRLNLIKAHQ